MLVKKVVFNIWNFYYNGFRGMGQWGRQVWAIIIVKLFIMFAILRIFFFPNFLNTNFDNDEQKCEHVLEILTNQNNNL